MPEITISKTVILTVRECQVCGIPFAFSDDLYESLRRNGGFYHCPNGHGWGWGTGTQVAELRQERERTASLRAQLDRESEARRQAENAAMDRARELKQLRTRARNGVCLHCNRSFANLKRHMDTKHKETS